jgi:hypothetical protein
MKKHRGQSVNGYTDLGDLLLPGYVLATPVLMHAKLPPN